MATTATAPERTIECHRFRDGDVTGLSVYVDGLLWGYVERDTWTDAADRIGNRTPTLWSVIRLWGADQRGEFRTRREALSAMIGGAS